MSWGYDESEPDAGTLKAVADLCENLAKARAAKDEAEKVVSTWSAEIKKHELKLIDHLKEAGLTSFKTPVGNFIITKRRSVKSPAGDQKEKFFAYLREQGIFDEMVSVHSATLNSWAAREIEAKESEGHIGWVPPGLDAPSEFESITYRKGK